MNDEFDKKLREMIREVIREELKHGKSAYDSKSGISATELKDKEGKTVGYIKHKRDDDTGGLVAAGRIGPKAAKAMAADAEEKSKRDEIVNELRKRMVHKEQKESNNEPDTSDDTPKDKPKTGEGRPDLTPYERAAAEYYRSKGYGPGSYTGD